MTLIYDVSYIRLNGHVVLCRGKMVVWPNWNSLFLMLIKGLYFIHRQIYLINNNFELKGTSLPYNLKIKLMCGPHNEILRHKKCQNAAI